MVKYFVLPFIFVNFVKKIMLIDKITNLIILYSQSKSIGINYLKLNQLLYYIQCWYIAKFDKDTLFDEMPLATSKCPIYISTDDKQIYYDIDLSNDEITIKLNECLKDLNLDADKEKLIFSVLDIYSSFSDIKLILLIHNDMPWNNARKELEPFEYTDKLISAEDIYNNYNK